jgi:hypothetical protein
MSIPFSYINTLYVGSRLEGWLCDEAGIADRKIHVEERYRNRGKERIG